MAPIPDPEFCYRAVSSRDARFDGWFFTAVSTTGIYCRPSCPAMTPRRANVRFYPSAAAAQQDGYRACLRCRPDAAPGSPEVNFRADLVGRAMRLIADGVVDRDGVGGLAKRLGYAERHVNRMLVAELGAGPLALARAQRAQTARILIESTSMSFADIAFASGFASVRQFNDTVNRVYAATPSRLREIASGRRTSNNTPNSTPTGTRNSAKSSRTKNEMASGTHPGTITLRLPFRAPFDAAGLFAFLGSRAIAGVESPAEDSYARTLRLPHGPGMVSCALTTPPVGETGQLTCAVQLADVRDLTATAARLRRLFDLDADPVAVDAALAADPALAPLVAKRPGVRLPGAMDGFEIAVRAIVGQQVSVAAARTTLGRFVAAVTDPLPADPAPADPLPADSPPAEPDPAGTSERSPCLAGGDLTHLFPTAETVAALTDDEAAKALPMPAARRRTILSVARAVADGDLNLDPCAEPDRTARTLLDLPGIGPWTAGYIAIRALSDPDGFLPTDLGVKHAARALGLPEGATELAELATAWRPWRSYAQMHLWHHLDAVGT